jgi:hypothetical protein
LLLLLLLLQVREQLQAKSVEEKRSQLRRIEAQIAAKEAENASVALRLTGGPAGSEQQLLLCRLLSLPDSRQVQITGVSASN